MLTKEAVIRNVNDGIYFQEEGRIFITNETWTENCFSMTFKNIQETIGFSPKYINDQNFLYVTITNEEIIISARIKGIDRIYKQIDAFELLEENVVTYENIFETKHRFSLNGIEICQIDSSLFINGQIFIYAKEGETIWKCQIDQMQSETWETNAGEPGVLITNATIDQTKMLRLQAAKDTEAIVSQIVSTNTTFATLSFDFVGSGDVYVNNKIIQSIESENLIRYEIPITKLNSKTPKIEFRTSSELYVGKVQFEENSYATAYIPNEDRGFEAVREGTLLTYPSKDAFLTAEGSLYIKITPQKSLNNHIVFTTDSEEFTLSCKNGTMYWEAMGQTVSIPYRKDKDVSSELFVTWSEHEISLSLDGEKKISAALKKPTLPVDKLVFADGQNVEPVVLEEWALFQNEFSMNSNIRDYLSDAVMYSLFDGGINGNNVSWVEIPVAPNDHSPILAEKIDGEPLQKVSFFDPDTGDYRTWNEEIFVYDGKSDFIDLAFSNINEQFTNLGITTEAGERIGQPYRISGKRLYFSFSEYEKIIYRNESLKAIYQVSDSYTVDYNIKAVDGYRIDFANYDGTDRYVYQEGNRFAEPVKLATMIEMNPIYNQNHTGFLYVSKTKNPTDDFRITVTPDRLKADGFSKSTIVIEPLDYQGNFLSHVNLTVKADKGFISRYIDKASAEAQKRSGQHLYQYTAPFISSAEVSETVTDHIWITDEDNHIGVCYPILLGPAESAHKLQMTTTEKNLLRDKTTLMNAVIMYESLEREEDAELFEILDLNQDNKISIDEIDVLSQNKRDVELSAIVQKLENWRGDIQRART